MDKVRFGRALGVGARQAAKSLMSAAEAAAAPDPRARPAEASPSRADSRFPAGMTERNASSQKPRVDARVVEAQTRALKKSFWGPFAKFSSVLWLEVTGTFFAIFAMISGLQVWRFHAALALPPSAPDARKLYVYILIFALFAYFTVSSFVQAGKRGRRG